MEDIIEVIIKGIWTAIKFIFYIVVFNIILFNVGRVTLLTATLGKYPRYNHIGRDSEKIASVGVLVLVVAWSAIAIFNNLKT